MAVVNEFALAQVPPEPPDQVTPALLVADEPAVIFTAPEFEQVLTSVPATAVGEELTTTVCSSETMADPQVGVEVQTIYQVPAPRPAAVGIYELPVAPVIVVIDPPDTERFPHWREVIVLPPVSETL